MATYTSIDKIIIKSLTCATIILLLIPYALVYGGNTQLLSESEYAGFLDTAAASMKANYSKIRTWQGEMNIQEYNYFYDEQCRNLPIDANSPAAHSNNICRSVSATVNYAVDIQNDKLYTKLIPDIKYISFDLNREIEVNERYSPVISVVTSSEYLSFKSDYAYAYERQTVKNGKWIGRKAFRLPLKETMGEQWGDIRDPRKYFFSGNKTFWEDLYAMRNVLVDPPADIPEGKAPQINISTEEINGHTLTYIKGKFYGSPACTDEDAFIIATMVLDSSVGQNLVRREVMDKTGKVLQILDITYENVSSVYVPKNVHFTMFRSSDQKMTFDSQVTFTKSILNMSIPEDTFDYKNLGLKNQDRFVDEIENKIYVYSDDKLESVTEITEN